MEGVQVVYAQCLDVQAVGFQKWSGHWKVPGCPENVREVSMVSGRHFGIQRMSRCLMPRK